MAELKPFEVIMRIDFAASKGLEVVEHAEKVQELVRCKDCKYYVEEVGACTRSDIIRSDMRIIMPNWFCADGVKKEQDNEK